MNQYESPPSESETETVEGLQNGDSADPETRGSRRSVSDGAVLWSTANAWQRAMKHAFAPLGLTHVQFMLLRSLARPSWEFSSVTQAMLARHTGVDEMMTSQVIRSLETKGLVRRGHHQTDSRARVLALTERGAEVTREAIRLSEEAEREFFAPLGEERDAVVAALDKLLARP